MKEKNVVIKSRSPRLEDLTQPRLEACPCCKKGKLAKTNHYSSLNPLVCCKNCHGVFYGAID